MKKIVAISVMLSAMYGCGSSDERQLVDQHSTSSITLNKLNSGNWSPANNINVETVVVLEDRIEVYSKDTYYDIEACEVVGSDYFEANGISMDVVCDGGSMRIAFYPTGNKPAPGAAYMQISDLSKDAQLDVTIGGTLQSIWE